LAHVRLSEVAQRNLAELIRSHSLPADTPERVKRSLRPLTRFPLLGAPLEGRWAGYRFLLGPWRWMVIVYVVADTGDLVTVVTIRDGRTAVSPTASRS